MHFNIKPAFSAHLNETIKYSAILIAIFFLACIPEKILFGGPPICLFYHFTGCQCPLCGMTHAVYFLVRLHPVISYTYNPAVLWLPILLFMEILHDLFPLKRLFRLMRQYSWLLFGITLILILVPRLIDCIK